MCINFDWNHHIKDWARDGEVWVWMCVCWLHLRERKKRNPANQIVNKIRRLKYSELWQANFNKRANKRRSRKKWNRERETHRRKTKTEKYRGEQQKMIKSGSSIHFLLVWSFFPLSIYYMPSDHHSWMEWSIWMGKLLLQQSIF